MSSTNKKHMKGGMDTSYQNINTEDERNQQAEELLFQAWEVAGYHGQPNEDFYPRTAKETHAMDELLTRAEAAVTDPGDHDLMEALAETRDVVEWSKQRHWTFAWWIVICVAIVGGYYFFQAGGDDDRVKQQQALTDEQVQKMLAENIQREEKNVADYEKQLAIDTLSDSLREFYEGNYESASERLKERKEDTVESYREYLVERAEGRASNTRWSGIWCFIWIVLYIFACRPRGYMITKRRREDQMARGLKKILFGISGALVGAAGALYVTETITTWSDGTKTRDDDSMIIYLMKFGLIALAVLIVLVAARILIVIATLLGLIRNYDWVQIAKDPKSVWNEMK